MALAPAAASAHIHLVSPLSRTDQLTGEQKEQHCGVANQLRNPARVTMFRPGQTITVSWMETIDHPGHFRIAFQANGAEFGIPPAGSGPPSGFPSVDQTGMTDAANGSIILKDFIPDGTSSVQVTLPNIECTNCTLQFIQVMLDKPPYTIDALSDDVYFNCADLTLSANAPAPDAGVPMGDDAGTTGPGTTTGGCSTGSGSLPVGMLVLVLVARRRR